MKRVKCYGRAKTNLVDASFKRDFFGQSLESSPGCSSYQDYREKTIEINTSSSDSENTDKCGLKPYELFASNIDISSSSSANSTHYTSTVSQRKSLKFLYRNKPYVGKQKSIQSNRQRLLKKNFPIKEKTITLKAQQTTVDSLPKLTGKKRKKKGKKLTSSFYAHQTGPTCKIESSLDPQPEPTSELQPKLFCKNSSKCVKYTRSYKLRKKRKINTSNHSPISVQPSCAAMCQYPLSGKKTVNKKKQKKCNIFNSRSDSFWAAIQPRWSSICDYSLNVEKITETNKVTTEQSANYCNQSEILLDSKDDILMNEKGGLLLGLKSNSRDTRLQIKESNSCKSSKTNNSLENKVSSVGVIDLEGVSSPEITFESMEVAEAMSVNIDTCGKNRKSDIFVENIENLSPYLPSVTSEERKLFYYSTPICSPVSHSNLVKISPYAKPFIPVSKTFITSTPSEKFKQTNKSVHISNVSKISAIGHKENDASFDFSAMHSRLLSCNKNSFVLSKKSRTLFQSSMEKRHPCMRSLSKTRESVPEDFRCSVRSCHSSTEAMHVSYLNSSESDFQSTLSKLLDFCGQTSTIPFKEIYDWRHTTIRKIGEGTYGEVYTLVQKKLSSVIKVIPFSENNDNHNMQSAESILSEVKVSQCLSELRNNKNNKTKNFGKLKSVHLVKGEYPAEMLVAWEKFSVARTTYNSKPDIFDDQQLFAIIELEYGGKDMGCFVLRNAVEAESVLRQIAISLAIAEETHLFEHRDLHLGNILVQRNVSKSISYVLRSQPFSIPNHGLVVTIIDFTLSRVLDDDCIFYNNLADDESLFNQSGDYQFEIYRAIKFHLNNEWHKSLLYSNVLWLIFLCKKLLEYEYSRPSSKKHQNALKNIKVFENNLQPCKSALESLKACGIITSIPEREKDSLSLLSAKTKLIDRKSLQKSTSRNPSLL